jgi:hypothetical protein
MHGLANDGWLVLVFLREAYLVRMSLPSEVSRKR